MLKGTPGGVGAPGVSISLWCSLAFIMRWFSGGGSRRPQGMTRKNSKMTLRYGPGSARLCWSL
jgi:hypothetical protein